MNYEITAQVVLETPPAGVDYGIQKGSGSKYETILKQRSVNKDLLFEFTITVKAGKENAFDFAGPVVQGKAGERFVYIDIGTYAGQPDAAWDRRLKIPLYGIADAAIKKVIADPAMILTTTVAGIGKDGGPNCGTVKPFSGWQLAKRK